MFSDFIIYVDESGDHSLDSVDINYPVFVLDFCIFKKSHYVTDVVPRVQELKFRYFGHDAIVLHEHEIRKQKPPFQILNDQKVRENFMGDLNETISGAEFTVIALLSRNWK